MTSILSNFFISAIAFVIVLGILIFIHELGHFWVARRFGVGIEKFSLGFGPRIWGKTVGITDYRISAIPLGGYVKMVGDEPDAQLEPEMLPLSFTHKHIFKKMLIVAAGPVFNLLLAVFIFFCFFCLVGVYDLRPVVRHVEKESPAAEAGLHPGDEITAINGKSVKSWTDISRSIASAQDTPVSVSIRRGSTAGDIILTPQAKVGKNIFGDEEIKYDTGVTPYLPMPAQVGTVAEGSPAQAAGLQKDDLILSINDHPVDRLEDLHRLVSQSNGALLSITIRRHGEIQVLQVTPVLEKDTNLLGEPIQVYRIGIAAPRISISESDWIRVRRGPIDSLWEGFRKTGEIVHLTLVSVAKLITGKLSPQTLGGPLMIAEQAGKQAQSGIGQLVEFIALISISLGILNLLPIPVLDGGHLLFFAIEAVIGRPVNLRFREKAQQAGLFILLLLMVFVFYIDIARLFR
ncbi:RIP metalloprotease RseP [Desulfosarcina sp. OttesenSCG-928-A07]|nr:RIP metalloprotease RseP [Desulfosarcina sp. OttesenSCG-928-G17]MDL2328557.1 RIP metalloprotease RseP [Desulfosarcina sp. OttesenSCG-928-A07]